MNSGVLDDDVVEDEEGENLGRDQLASVRWNVSHVNALPAPAAPPNDDEDDDARSMICCVGNLLLLLESSASDLSAASASAAALLLTTAAARKIGYRTHDKTKTEPPQ
jgi:hypothetical protein